MQQLTEVRKIFTIDEDSFETYLDYEYYENGLFWMKDRCFFAIEIVGGIYYYSPSSDLKSYYSKMTTLLRSLPVESEASVQSLFLPYRDIEFKPPASKSSNDFVTAAYHSVEDHIQRAVKFGYFDSTSTLRDVKNLLFVIFPKKTSTDKLKKFDLKEAKSKFLSWKRAFLKALDMHAVQYDEMSASDFLYAMFTLLNQDFDPIRLEYLKSERLSRQLLYNVLTTTPKDIRYQKKRWVMAYLRNLRSVKPGMLVELMTLQRPFFVASTLHRASPTSLQIRLWGRERAELTKERRLMYKDLISEVMTKILYKSEVYFGFLIEDESEIELVKSELSAFTSEYNWIIEFEDQIAPDLFRSSLPAHYNLKAQRELYMYEEHALSLLNFRNFRKKFSSSGIILVGEDLSPQMVSVFDSQAYGTLVSGGSGSGKTFFSQYSIIMALAAGQKVVVIDPLGNFESLCTLIGGSYYRVGVSNKSSGIDIFPDYTSEEYVENKQATLLILQFLGKLVRFGNTDTSLSARARTMIERTLEHMYRVSVTKDIVTFVDILEAFYEEDRDELTGELLASLQPFLPSKTYGGLISDQEMSMEKDFIVFDISEIKEHRALTQLAIYGLMSKISPTIIQNPGRQKVVYIDEAHYLVSDKESADFIKGGVRVWRTFNGALTLITQQLTDMLENREVGEGIFKTLENFFLLSQSAESIRVGRSYIGYNSSEQKALNGLRTLPGKYSQLAFYTKGHKSDGNPAFGRFYLALPRYLYWTFTTAPMERAKREDKINELLDQGYTRESATAQAIQLLVREEEETDALQALALRKKLEE